MKTSGGILSTKIVRNQLNVKSDRSTSYCSRWAWRRGSLSCSRSFRTLWNQQKNTDWLGVSFMENSSFMKKFYCLLKMRIHVIDLNFHLWKSPSFSLLLIIPFTLERISYSKNSSIMTKLAISFSSKGDVQRQNFTALQNFSVKQSFHISMKVNYAVWVVI